MSCLVVTPTLGQSPWLAETVASVARVAGACEHVLVAPREVTAALAVAYPQLTIVAETGGGMYAAINAGVAAAKSEWSACTYLNDDDVLLPGFNAGLRMAEKAAGRPLLVYGGVRLIDRFGKRLGCIPVSPLPRWNRTLYAERLEPVYQHGTLVTRPAWTRLGGFDEQFRLCGDSEFLARACVEGLP